MRPGRLLLRLLAPVTPRTTIRPVVVAAALLAIAVASPVAGAPRAARPEPPAQPAVHLPPPAGSTALVSARFGGGFASGGSAQASISADGRFVAFASSAANLVPGDTNNAVDVFVRDMVAGTTVRATLPGGTPVPPGGSASDPSISADGRIVAFTFQPPSAAGAVALPAGSVVIAWDRTSGASEIVSLAGTTPARPSYEASVSGDGRLIAYTTDRDGVIAGDDNGSSDVYIFDRVARTTRLVSVAPTGLAGEQASRRPAIAADGNSVAFESDAGDLVPGDDNGETDVFVRDLAAGTTEWISVVPVGSADNPSGEPAISADGRLVAFESRASNLTANDVPNTLDVFLRDRSTASTSLVSVNPAGLSAKGDSGQPAISADGRIVAFASTAQDVVAAADGGAVLAAQLVGRAEVYARDVVHGETIRISEAAAGGPGGLQSVAPAIGGNGRYVAFSATSSLLVVGDDNRLSDVFLRDLPPDPRVAPPALDFGTRALGTSAPPLAAVVSNVGWGPFAGAGATVTGAQAGDFAVVFDGCVGTTVHRGEACTVSVTFTPSEAGTRDASLRLPDDAPGSPRIVRLRGSGSLARLELDPELGPPGIVVIATGSGFPPGAEVSLRWSIGLTQPIAPIVADAEGDFRVQVLVFHNDRIGTRDLVAAPVDGGAFPEFGERFLVTTPAAIPPSFSFWASGEPPPAMVIRR